MVFLHNILGDLLQRFFNKIGAHSINALTMSASFSKLFLSPLVNISILNVDKNYKMSKSKEFHSGGSYAHIFNVLRLNSTHNE